MRILVACKNCNTQYDVTGKTVADSLHCRCGATIVVAAPKIRDGRVVRCASCGAVRGSGGDNCEYCGARLSSVDKGWGSMCPGCFCRLPTDARYCVECGLKIEPQPLRSSASSLPCPRCKVPLQGRAVEKIQLEECASCAGTWLPVSTFESICRDHESMGLATLGLNRAGRRARFELTSKEEVKYVPCPVCKNLMNRRNFGRVSGVIIDVCRDCGVWLDNQELNRIIQFIQSGGLERTRDLEGSEREHQKKMAQPGLGAMLPLGGPSISSGASFSYSSPQFVPGLVRAAAEIARAFLS